MVCHFINKILRVNFFLCAPVEMHSFEINFSVLTVQSSW